MEFYYDQVDKDVLILSADGGLLYDNADHFVGELEHYIDLGIHKLVVDCTKITRISSYGLGVLISVHKRLAKRGGDVKLASVSGIVGKIIEMTGTGSLLDIYPSVEEARMAFAGEGESATSEPNSIESQHPHLGKRPR
jgi:anti-sigma B factor antagonist